MFFPEDFANKAQGKQKTAIMFDPQKEREAKRKRAIAEMLIQKGNMPQKNEQAGGMTVARSPWENINQAAQNFMGQYQLEGADNQMAEAEKRRQEMIREALSNQDPMQAAQILAQDPNTSDAAIKMYSDVLGDQRRLEQLKAVGGRGSVGAIETLTNRILQENPGLSFMDALTVAQKGLGQGVTMNPDGTIRVLGENIPSQPMNVPLGSTPFVPQQTPIPQAQDPLQEHQNAVMQQQQQTGVNPMQRPELMQQGVNTPAPQGGSFADVQARLAATKKGAEENAKQRALIENARELERQKTLGAPMPANIVQRQDEVIQKIQTSQGLERSMNKFTNMIDTGELDLGLMSNLENMARNNMAMSTEQSRNLASFKSTLERLRNESLRLNNGVQTDGDAQRAWNELIANINDPQVVRQRLQEIGEINRIGAQLQEENLNLMRSEYGRESAPVPSYQDIQQRTQQPQAAQQPQAQNREQIIEKLRASGVPEERIMQYIQAKGL